MLYKLNLPENFTLSCEPPTLHKLDSTSEEMLSDFNKLNNRVSHLTLSIGVDKQTRTSSWHPVAVAFVPHFDPVFHERAS